MAVYEEYLPPKRRPDKLSDKLPWRYVAAPGVIGHKDQGHSLQRTYGVRGPDPVGLAPEVQGVRMMQANNALKRLPGRWMLQSEAQRVPVLTLPGVPDDAPLLVRLLDRAYRASLLTAPGLRETTYFHTLTWTPPSASTEGFMRFFTRGPGATWRSPDPEAVSVMDFLTQSDMFMGLLQGILAECTPLTTVDTLAYLHSCVSDRWRPWKLPGSLVDIDYLLCDSPLDPSGWYPQLGAWHLRTCSLKAYPRESIVGMMRTLEGLDLDFRWCTRQIALPKQVQEGILRKAQKAWVHEEKGFSDRLSENITHEGTRVLNTDALNKASEVDIARQEIGADVIAYGAFTSTVTTWHTDPQVADEQRRLIMQAFADRGIGTVEEGVHQEAAWLSSHPGNRLDNVNASHQSTLTLAHLSPGLTAAWRGPSRDAYLKGGPWCYARTEGNTLFRVVNHFYDEQSGDFRDLGHFLTLGYTGSGKSTLSAWLRLMWHQYTQAGQPQTRLFDIKRHGKLLTLLLGGNWYDLGDPSWHAQPLRHVDDLSRRRTILQWVLDLLAQYHVPITAPIQRYVSSNLERLARYPAPERTFTTFLELLVDSVRMTEAMMRKGHIDSGGQMHADTHMPDLLQQFMAVRNVLKLFTAGGDYNGVFDGHEEDFDDNPVQTFELDDLLAQSQLLQPVMRYVLPQVEYQMSTDCPMMLTFDDAAIPLEVPYIRQDAKGWLRTARKLGVSVGFATHSLEDLFGKESPIGEEMAAILLESCPVRFYLPNPEASKASIRPIYRRLGLEDPAIDQIAVMQPRRDVYYELREMGQRPIVLKFPRIILDCIARNTADDHRLIDEILQKEGREGFCEGWMRHHGYAEEFDALVADSERRTDGDDRG
jgi:type IV secretion system protein TrbE